MALEHTLYNIYYFKLVRGVFGPRMVLFISECSNEPEKNVSVRIAFLRGVSGLIMVLKSPDA